MPNKTRKKIKTILFLLLLCNIYPLSILQLLHETIIYKDYNSWAEILKIHKWPSWLGYWMAGVGANVDVTIVLLFWYEYVVVIPYQCSAIFLDRVVMFLCALNRFYFAMTSAMNYCTSNCIFSSSKMLISCFICLVNSSALLDTKHMLSRSKTNTEFRFINIRLLWR